MHAPAYSILPSIAGGLGFAFKTGNGEAQQQLIKESQEILRKYGIDPIAGEENLVWAPNGITGQHDITALQQVVDALREVDEAGGDYDDIVNVN